MIFLNNLLISKIAELKNSNVRIKNPYYVDMILANLIQGGVERLQVVSDFDRTISLCHFDGKPCPTSNAVLEMSRFVTDEIRKQVFCSNSMLSFQFAFVYLSFYVSP